MSAAFVLRMFGALRLETGSESVTKFPTKRSALILARLANAKEHRMGRDELAEFLWPDDFLDVTRIRLRQELRRLRQAVGSFGEHLRADRQWVELEPGSLGSDVEMFEAAFAASGLASDPAARVQCLRQAVALLKGPFLVGYQEPWVLATRRDYEEKGRRSWLELADTLQILGELDEALKTTVTAVRNSPLDIDANAALIRRLAERGQAGQARQAFLDFDATIFRELGYHAPQSVRALIRETAIEIEDESVSFSPTPRVQVVRPVPLFGRDELLQTVEGALSRPGSCIVLLGGIGVGKTHLLKELVWRFAHSGALPVRFGGSLEQVADGLFVPDPCEDLGQLLQEIHRAAASGWRVLSESRVRLDAEGITEILVGPLSVPEPGDTADAILENASVKVLLSKLNEQGGGLVAAAEVPALGELARRLDGLPVALKIFGSRLTIQSPDQVLRTFEDGLAEFAQVLQEPLSQTVLALPSHLKDLLFSLALLDGASADLATSLAEPYDPAEAWRTLERLCLIGVHDDGLRHRYRIPAPLAFVIRRVLASEDTDKLISKTWRDVTDWAFAKSRQMAGPDQDHAFRSVQAEITTLRRGMEWAIEADPELAGRMVVATWRTVCARGNTSVECDVILRAVKAAVPVSPVEFLGEAWIGTGTVSSIAGRTEDAEIAYLEAIKLYESEGHIPGLCWAKMNYAANIVLPRDPALAVQLCREAADRTTGVAVRTIALCFLAYGLADLGETAEALRVGEAVFAERLQSKDFTEHARGYGDLAELYRRVGRPEAARPLLTEGVRLLRKAGIQDMLFDAVMRLIAVSEEPAVVLDLLDEASSLANRIGSHEKLLVVARAHLKWASQAGDVPGMLLAVEDMFRFTQLTHSFVERRRSLLALADELGRHGRVAYAHAVKEALGEPVGEPIQAGWRALLSSDSHGTVCVLAVVMAKEALQTEA